MVDQETSTVLARTFGETSLSFYQEQMQAVELRPTVSVSRTVKNIKGSSSYFVNQELAGDDWLYWQEGYAAFTVSKRNLKRVMEYVDNQKMHHAKGSLIKAYEDTDDE